MKWDEDIGSVIRSVDRAADIIEKMRKLAHAEPGAIEKIQLAYTVEKAIGFFRNQLDQKNISMETDFQAGLPDLFIDPIQFEHVAFNLLSNAVHAVEDRAAMETGPYQKKIIVRLYKDQLNKAIYFESRLRFFIIQTLYVFIC